MHPLLISVVASFVITFVLLPFIIRFARKRNLFDSPGQRRIHKKITPSLGGAAIFAGFTFGSLLSLDPSSWNQQYFLLPILTVPFILGILDDVTHLRPAAKLIGQTITATLIFFILDVRVLSDYNLFDTGDLPISVSYFLTVAITIAITNAYNLIDGIDGLAAAFAAITIGLLGTWFYFAGDIVLPIFCFAFCGGIVSFLFQNWEPSKIFMGDTGSLVIGTMLSIITIQFLNQNERLAETAPWKFQNSATAAACFLIIPLVDTIRIIIIRLRKGISPFKADKRHIHHSLVRIGLSHRQAVSILCLIHVVFITLAVILKSKSNWILLAVAAMLATVLCLILDLGVKRQVTESR